MYLKEPQERENAMPYLAPYRNLHNFPSSEEYKQDFLDFVKFLSANRLQTWKDQPARIEWWEYIFKIKFEMRFWEKKTKFFESNR